MQALNDLVRSGKVRYIGASSMWACKSLILGRLEAAKYETCFWRHQYKNTDQFAQLQFCAEKNGWTKFVSMQNQYSLCYREEEREMNKYCHETGVGLIPWAPLFRGFLARPPDTEKTTRGKSVAELTPASEKIIKRVEELANQKGWKMSQVALAWVIQKKTIPIVGFSNTARLQEAIEVRGKTLTEEEIKYLEEPYVDQPIFGHS